MSRKLIVHQPTNHQSKKYRYYNIFFDNFISDRNKEFALEQGYEYIEIKEKQSFRNSGTWLKLYNVKKYKRISICIYKKLY